MFHIGFIATMTGLGRIIQLLARWLPGTALIGALSFVEMLYAADDAHRTITGCTAIRRDSDLGTMGTGNTGTTGGMGATTGTDSIGGTIEE